MALPWLALAWPHSKALSGLPATTLSSRHASLSVACMCQEPAVVTQHPCLCLVSLDFVCSQDEFQTHGDVHATGYILLLLLNLCSGVHVAHGGCPSSNASDVAGFCVAYLVFIAQNLEPMTGYRGVYFILAACPIVAAITMLTGVRALAPFSLIADVANVLGGLLAAHLALPTSQPLLLMLVMYYVGCLGLISTPPSSQPYCYCTRWAACLLGPPLAHPLV